MVRLLTAIVALVITAAAQAEILQGRVVGVSDGDTITVLDVNRQQHKVRLAGIDAPEKRQAFGDVSKQNLASYSRKKSLCNSRSAIVMGESSARC